jgi:DNA-binding XRE family transcriptional regulator
VTKTRSPSKTKKPKWSILTYARIERRRKELGLSKAAMAEALGVTNSTYHNWRRGTTVPHPNQQELLKVKMLGLTPKGARPAGRNGTTRRCSNGSSNGNGAAHRATRRPGSRVTPGTSGLGSRDTGGGHQCSTALGLSPTSLPLVPVAGVPGIAAITVAFIESQKKPPSAGSVVSFVSDLQAALVLA